MGFPVGYTETLIPNLLLHTLSLLSLVRSLVLSVLNLLGLPNFLDNPTHLPQVPTQLPYPPLSAILTRELLPVTKFKLGDSLDNCAFCLNDFVVEEDIRCLPNCKHIFHRGCLDRWLDHDQRTCPLCRAEFVPHDLKEEFDQRLWAVSGVEESFTEYSSSITSAL